MTTLFGHGNNLTDAEIQSVSDWNIYIYTIHYSQKYNNANCLVYGSSNLMAIEFTYLLYTFWLEKICLNE